uniref:Helicase n=1 Tax=Siphoviridae sp. ctWDo30 TaxID=2826360 RepID=A0A8S5N5W8_9CAUD|nr:MAG TPA: helicase [Siphoviridae sp. ctWDo30]
MGLMDIFRVSSIKHENEELKTKISDLECKLSELGADNYFQVKEKADTLNSKLEEKIKETETKINSQLEKSNNEITNNNNLISKQREELSDLTDQNLKLAKQISTQIRKLSRCKELYQSIEHAMDNFFLSDVGYANCKLPKADYDELELISPSVILKLHCMDVKALRKSYRENEKQINKLLEQYSSRYTTKANKSIYNLMVIALRAELQNILYNLKYEKLEKSVEDVKIVSAKYLKIAGEGNQSIAGTLTKFIGEIEYLFINAVKIEYNYYVKKEQARQEQLAIKEQMRQEAEERKALESEKKKVAKEEEKYKSEIEKLQESIKVKTSETEIEKLQARILELQGQLSDVILKKEEITNLQNGKAGNVYIISNLGSFGEDVFKIGMTRRLDPQDRVNELGSASVPFKFDVHSFIFSEDAVGLESKLHDLLNSKRLNKVNLRKEFFKVPLDELENLVTDIEPTAEFNRTMLAEEFRQSLSSDQNYTAEFTDEDIDDEE